jgi:hypothetical protein
MKKILFILLIILFSNGPVICGEFEDTLKKAEQGIAEAQHKLGSMYSKGEGVSQDQKQALYWHTKLTSGSRPTQSQFPMVEEQSFGDYVVRIYSIDAEDAFEISMDEENSFEILHKGVRVHVAQGYFFRIGSIYEEDKTNSLISIGSDITGDGMPNLVVSEWTGGGHCCFMFHIFEIGSKFRYIQTINAMHSDGADFKNVDDDPALEFPMVDWTFAYWRTNFNSSLAAIPVVILKYNGKKYEMAYELMRKPSLPHVDLIQMAIDIRTSQEWAEECPPVKLWARMIDLIYTGNMNHAWHLVELAWPSGMDGKEEFLRDFRSELATSPFWTDVNKLNKKRR